MKVSPRNDFGRTTENETSRCRARPMDVPHAGVCVPHPTAGRLIAAPTARFTTNCQFEKGSTPMMTPKEVAAIAAKALDNRKGVDISLLEITDVTTLADYFLICTGTSNTHVKSLCESLPSAGKATAAAPGSCWTTAAWWSMCSPRKQDSFTIWSAFGATPSGSIWKL